MKDATGAASAFDFRGTARMEYGFDLWEMLSLIFIRRRYNIISHQAIAAANYCVERASRILVIILEFIDAFWLHLKAVA